MNGKKIRKALLLLQLVPFWCSHPVIKQRRYLSGQNSRADPCFGSWWVFLCKTEQNSLNFFARVDDFFGLMMELLSWANLLHALLNGSQAPNHPPLPLNRLSSILTNVLKDFFQEQTPPVYFFCFCKLYCVPHRADITKWRAVPSSPLCYPSRARRHYPAMRSSGFLFHLVPWHM